MWIKWYPMQWLHSTCRDELSAAERATFQDFVCLAAISPTPGSFKFVSNESLARTLNAPIVTIKTTMEKCVKKNRLSLEDGPEGMICTVIKWPDYQSLGPKKTNVKNSINFNFDTEKWEGIKTKDIEGWKEAYPADNVELELKAMKEWLLSNPTKKKSNYRKFITNWLKRQQDRGGSKGLRPKDTWAEKKAEEMKKK